MDAPVHPRRRRPDPVVWGLVLACVAWTMVHILVDSVSLFQAGALTKEAAWEGELWRLLSSLFLHADWVHLSFNAISLLFVGNAVARSEGLGRRALVFFLFLTALCGTAASLLFNQPDDLGLKRIGFSGGLFGLLGLILAAEWGDRAPMRVYLRRFNVLLVLFFLALNVLIGLGVFDRLLNMNSELIDQAAHIGGFVAGLVIGVATYGRTRTHVPRAAVASALLVGVPLFIAVAPFWDSRFHVVRGEAAYRARDLDTARERFERALELDSSSVVALARVAELKDDPSLLDHEPERRLAVHQRDEARVLSHVLFILGKRRFQTDLEASVALLQRAQHNLSRRWAHARETHTLVVIGAVKLGDFTKASEALAAQGRSILEPGPRRWDYYGRAGATIAQGLERERQTLLKELALTPEERPETPLRRFASLVNGVSRMRGWFDMSAPSISPKFVPDAELRDRARVVLQGPPKQAARIALTLIGVLPRIADTPEGRTRAVADLARTVEHAEEMLAKLAKHDPDKGRAARTFFTAAELVAQIKPVRRARVEVLLGEGIAAARDEAPKVATAIQAWAKTRGYDPRPVEKPEKSEAGDPPEDAPGPEKDGEAPGRGGR